MTRESDGASTTLVTTEEQDIDAVMRIITSLRTKHQPQVTVGDSVHTVSTVGLVVGGTRIERVVPGGPCDREFHAERIENGDSIVMVDGKEYPPSLLPGALVGDDVIGSQVRLTIRKKERGRTFDCVVERGALARIHAVGRLFVILSELISDVDVDQKVLSVSDLLRVESQMKVVNDMTNTFLRGFKRHVRDLEEALFEMQQTNDRSIARRIASLQKEVGDKNTESRQLVVRAEEAEAKLRAALVRENRRDDANETLQSQVEELRSALEESRKQICELDAEVKESRNRAGNTKLRLVQFETRVKDLERELYASQTYAATQDALLKECETKNKQLEESLQARSHGVLEFKQLQKEVEKVNDKLAKSSQELEHTRGQLESCIRERDSARGELRRMEMIIADLHGRCDKCRCEALQAELTSALDLVKELETKLKPKMQLV